MSDADILAPGFTEEPYWWEEARPAPSPEVGLPPRCDVLVIGGGYAGLNAARILARGGAEVVVADAEAPGFGGSSRNGGQVTGGWNMIDLAAADPGAMRGRVADGLRSQLDFEALVGELGLSHCYMPTGKYVAAFAPKHFDALRRKAEWAVREGVLEAEAVAPGEAEGELGSRFYHGGVRYTPGGLVQPAVFHAGLLEAAVSAGATVASSVKVEALQRTGRGYRVRTSVGETACTDVVVATNGYTGAVVPDLQRRVVPVASYIIATEPLDPDVARGLIPKRRAISDTASVLSYFRLSPDGRRMVYGGRVTFAAIGLKESARGLHRMMSARFPQLAQARVTHSWRGNVAFARDRLPHMGSSEGLHWALCCNGSGVAMMTWLGGQVARRILDRTSSPVCAFDGGRFPAIPLYDGRPWFVPLFGALYRARDRLARPA